MEKTVKIGDKLVGHGRAMYVIAEVGINHNGSVDTAKRLIDAAIFSGCDSVKFQKRTIEVVYPPEELAKPRETPFGTTNGEMKRRLEFGYREYAEIDRYCRERGIHWFASCWDEASVDFIERFGTPCYKIASACLTDDNLLRYHRQKGRPIILSTGMSGMAQIEHAVEILGQEDLILLHCTSTYPSKPAELNLRGIFSLRQRFPGIPVGYSGHEIGLATSVATAALGACVVERHITLDRAMWGSDQAASVEPHGFSRMVRDIRIVEQAMGDGNIRILESELPIMEKLRRVK